jgi:hypothetical protein
MAKLPPPDFPALSFKLPGWLGQAWTAINGIIGAVGSGPVANTAALQGIAPADRFSGMTVVKIDTGDVWEFELDSATSADAWTVVPTVAGTAGVSAGRWKRRSPSLVDLATTGSATLGANLIGLRNLGGIIIATTVEGALAEIKALVDAGMPVSVREADVVFGGLAAGNSNGASVSVNLGAVLPANANPFAFAIELGTPFTGGGATAVTLDIGTAGDPVSHVVGADVLHAAVDGYAFTMPLGKAPFKRYVSAGAQLLMRFTPDGSHQLANLTAGAAHVRALYTVKA